ncbi:hypothetical protein GJAV_G00045580 [Gymnothorax javanicus]|nr:hypothetical protein GJAV_G00045580 [Gymnothorax javanicus]
MKMTKPKMKVCPICNSLNAANCKTCNACFAGLTEKERVKKREAKITSGDWAANILRNHNACRVLDSARISVKKLHALGFQPILLLGRRSRAGGFTADIMSGLGPLPKGPVCDIFTEIVSLYEYFLRNYSEPVLTSAPPPNTASAPPPATAEASLPTTTATTPPPAKTAAPPPATSATPPPATAAKPPPNTAKASPPKTAEASPPATSIAAPSTSAAAAPPTTAAPPPTIATALPSAKIVALPRAKAPSPSSTSGSALPPTRKRKHPERECQKQKTQKLFFFKAMTDKRRNKGTEEVKVRWPPRSASGKEWEETWETAKKVKPFT